MDPGDYGLLAKIIGIVFIGQRLNSRKLVLTWYFVIGWFFSFSSFSAKGLGRAVLTVL